MVYGSMGHFLRKFKRKKGIDRVAEDGYVPPKPAYLWQRRRRQEERMDNEKKEQVTQTKINPWFQLCSSLQNQTAMALFSFPGDVQAGELEAWEGDPLKIESVDRTEVWWQAVNMRTGKSGFIPWNYITEETGVKDVVGAWHEIDRRESEIKLTMPDLPNGTYVLRPSSNPLRIALSVLCIVGSAKIIKHFSVRYDSSLSGYFITPGKRFTQLKDLTDYYKVSHGGKVPLLSSSMPHSPPPIQSRNLRIPLEKLELKTHIARGGRFGSVYKAVCTTSGKRSVVVKKISGHMGRGAVVARAEACHKLHNRAIVQFIGLCEAPKSGLMLLVWEYMPGGNLRDFLIKNKTTTDYIRLQHWLHQILDGMDYLEGVEAFHGELTASNVFLSSELCAKIGNFGFNGRFSKFISDAFDLAETQAVRWAAPESLDSSHVFDIRCDIWSFGVVMFEVFTLGSTPYKDMDVEEVVERVKAGYRLPNPTSLGFYCEEVMYETMKNCWNTDSTGRPTFHELWFVFEDHLAKDGDVYAEIE
ncbi:proto oncolocus tag tyrosine protein kinase LCK [Echinococcus multilocularis]|uniref:Tyrosine-protein kinase n=1 Tax=Echinococcus multilocularis TaxID=6211 RepID=A0A068Y3T2_ECHMU|nr:proto oncolocus tag tyrosine protein kinase LCK [Echinococcus multilocularis]